MNTLVQNAPGKPAHVPVYCIGQAAYIAIKAARCVHIWGREAAMRFAERHGSNRSLVRLAIQLEAVEQDVLFNAGMGHA
jgi:hypothetical protein